MPFKAVPFDSAWITSDKIDIKAVYRRPAYDAQGRRMHASDGRPLWDVTTPLPVRRHNDWAAKGYEYITLADAKSLSDTAPLLRANNLNPSDFVQDRGGSPWNSALYLQHETALDVSKLDELRRMVHQFGSEALETIKRGTDPTFELPADLRDIPPGGPKLDLAKPSRVQPGEIHEIARARAKKPAPAPKKKTKAAEVPA